MKIVLIGIQGSGKSTQGNKLSEKLSIPYLSTGHIFRDLSKESSSLGRMVKETMNAGYLITDEETLKIVSEYLKRPEYAKGYILDGFPRTRTQAEEFENGIDAALYINVPDEEAIRRLSFRNDGREDEAPPALQKRIELFHKFTEPVIDYYREKGKLHEINGEGSIESIHEEISKVLNLN
jgi:adenylate kinase